MIIREIDSNKILIRDVIGIIGNILREFCYESLQIKTKSFHALLNYCTLKIFLYIHTK